MIPADLHPIWFAVIKGSVLALGAVVRVLPRAKEPVVLVDAEGSRPLGLTYAEIGGLVGRRDLLPITEAEAAILQPGALSPHPARPPHKT
jgi:hypothetical protein